MTGAVQNEGWAWLVSHSDRHAFDLRFVRATLLGQPGISHALRPMQHAPCSACCIGGTRCVLLSTRATVLGTHVCNAVGKHGMVQEKGLVVCGVCWTAGACAGGYTAASRAVVDILRQRARPYLFSNTVRSAIRTRLLPALLAI